MQQDHGDRDLAPDGAGVPAVRVCAEVGAGVEAWGPAPGAWAQGPVLAVAIAVAGMVPVASALPDRGRSQLALSPMTLRPSEPRQRL
jgi:hypothetical protein